MPGMSRRSCRRLSTTITSTRTATVALPDCIPSRSCTMSNPGLNADAPLINIRVGLQRSVDSVGHALRAIEEYRPERDHTLPGGIIAALGVSTQSHVPGAPIALQLGPSVPM